MVRSRLNSARFYQVVGRWLSILLALGLLSPVSAIAPISNAAAVTKQFFVKGSNGSPLSQALVRMFWYDEAGQLHSSEPVTTGENGIAQVSLPSEAPGFGQYVVVPALGDTANAIAFSDSELDLGELAESTTVTLNSPSLFVEIQDVDGSPVYSSTDDLSNQLFLGGPQVNRRTYLPRSGAFGVALQNLAPQETYTVRLLHFGDKSRATQSRYTLRTIDPSQGQFTVLDGPIFDGPAKAGMPTLEPVDGVYRLKYRAPNLRLVAAVPGGITTASGIYQYTIGKSGSPSALAAASSASGNPINFSVETGSYVATITPIGINELYIATSFEFTVANGVPSLPGSVQTVNQISYVPLDLTNFRFKIVGPDSTPRPTGYVSYCNLILNDGNYDLGENCDGFPVDGETAVGGAKMADGAYALFVNPGNNVLEGSKTLGLMVTAGVAMLFDIDSGVTSTAKVDGRYLLATEQANLHVLVKDSSGQSIAINQQQNQGIAFTLFKADENGQFEAKDSFGVSAATFAFKITDSATYKVAVGPWNIPGVACTVSPLFTYANGKFTVTGKSGEFNSLTGDNTLTFNLGSQDDCPFNNGGGGGDGGGNGGQNGNFKIKLANPSNDNPVSGWVNICRILSEYECEGVANIDQFNNLGEGSANIETTTATYRIDVNSNGFARSAYQLSVLNGNFTLVGKSGAVTPDGNGRFTIRPAIANVSGRVTDENNQPIPFVYSQNDGKGVSVNLEKWTPYPQGDGGDFQHVPFSWAQVSETGTFLMSITDTGTYRVVADPYGYGNLSRTPGDSFTVVAAGSSVNFNTGTQVVSNLTGANSLSIKVKSANLRLKLVKPNTSEATNGWICIQEERPAESGAYFSISCLGANQEGLISANVPSGTYRLEVNSQGYARKFYDLTVAVNGSATIKDGNTTLQLDNSSSRYFIAPAVANVTGKVLGPSGETLTLGGMNQWVGVSLFKKQDGDWWQWIQGSGTDNEGNFSFSVTDAGLYRVEARPGTGLVNMAPATSAEFQYSGTAFSINSVDKGAELADGDRLTISLSQPNFRVKLVNPSATSTVLTQGWINILRDLGNGGWAWSSNIDINAVGGEGSVYIDTSTNQTLRLEVNTNLAGYARSYYTVRVEAGVISLYSGLLIDNSAKVNAVAGVFAISPGKPNVTGRVFDNKLKPLGSTNGKWVNINVQKLNSLTGDWDWTQNNSNTNFDGRFSINITETGTYRLRIEPNGFADATTSYSDTFTLATINATVDFPNLTLALPTLMLKVALSPSALTPLNFIGIEVKRDGAWIDWLGTGPTGVAGLSLKDAGTYELVLHPGPAQISAGAARKSYEVVATKVGGVVTAVITGVTKDSVGGFHLLTLGSGNVKGRVLFEGLPISNVGVVAREAGGQREFWEYSAQSGSNGAWSMNLPEGKYNIVAVPWGSTLYGRSNLSAEVTVASNGTATIVGGNVESITLNLLPPKWKGSVSKPENLSEKVPFAGVSLFNDGNWYGTSADAQGNFALSVPGFTSFSSDAFLEIRDDRFGALPMRRWQGSAEVATVLNPAGSDSVSLQFAGANFTVVVTAGGQPAANVWVNVDADGVGWLGGNRTNAQGQAKLSLKADELGSGLNMRVRADVGSNPTLSANYSSAQTTLSLATVKSALEPVGASYTATIALQAPNLRAELREPSSGGVDGKVASWAWIELFRESTGEWLQGTSTDQNGLFTLNISEPEVDTFTMNVNPSWNSSSDVSKNQYQVVVTAGVAKIYKSGVEITQTVSKSGRTYTKLTLGSPSVRGKVTNSSSQAIRDSWVVPVNKDTGEYMWQLGTNSKSDGGFALALPAGNYRLEANVPWNSSNLAKSSPCDISVSATGTVTIENSCKETGTSTVALALREPNLTMTLRKPGSPAPTALAYAWVGICIERFCTGGQSDKDGKVSIFVDNTAINQANGYSSSDSTERDISINVNPPWGNSDVAPYNCRSSEDSKAICSGIGNYQASIAYPNTAVGTVTLPGPNLTLFIAKPAGGALANAWVNLFESGGNWLGGSNTDNTGKASFNITNAEALTYRVEVNPPWNESTKYSRVTVDGLSYANTDGETFTIGAPNLTISVKTSTNAANKWGWINLEESSTSFTYVGGYGLDNNGMAAITLAPNKNYRITANAGPGATGARSTCDFSTNGSSVITSLDTVTACIGGALNLAANPDLLELQLSSGNYVGTVTDGSANRVAGAIVVATAMIGGVERTVKAVTASDGVFKMLLDPAEWNIEIIPVQPVNGVQLSSETRSVTIESLSTVITETIVMGA